MKPDWLVDTNLTRFDVPGLCNEIWVNSTGIQCYDTDQMAGCVLGGGTAVNAGLWWKVSILPILNTFIAMLTCSSQIHLIGMSTFPRAGSPLTWLRQRPEFSIEFPAQIIPL